MKRSKNNNNVFLIALPHAGGSSLLYRGWGRYIDCNVVSIDYPGHWSRSNEPLVNTFDDLKKDVFSKIKGIVEKDSNIMIFGHSLGAIVAWSIANDLLDEGFKSDYLFLSGSQNPGAFPEQNITCLASDEDILKLVGYNYNNNEKSKDYYRKVFLPILKNDLQICREYKRMSEFINTSAFVFYGIDDVFTQPSEVYKWNQYVKCESIIGMPGGHIFIEDVENKKKIFSLINHVIKERYELNDNNDLLHQEDC